MCKSEVLIRHAQKHPHYTRTRMCIDVFVRVRAALRGASEKPFRERFAPRKKRDAPPHAPHHHAPSRPRTGSPSSAPASSSRKRPRLSCSGEPSTEPGPREPRRVSHSGSGCLSPQSGAPRLPQALGAGDRVCQHPRPQADRVQPGAGAHEVLQRRRVAHPQLSQQSRGASRATRQPGSRPSPNICPEKSETRERSALPPR